MIDELMTLDLSGDGLDDSLLYYDESGKCNILSDFDYDGNYEQLTQFSGTDYWGNPTDVMVMVDTDNNGVLDTGFYEQSDELGNIVAHADFNDYNQDGQIDMLKGYADTTGDGLFDVVTTLHGDNTDSPILQTMDISIDQTGDQTPDVSLHAEIIDSTGDGQPNIVEMVMSDSYGQEFSFEVPYDEYVAALGEDYSNSVPDLAFNTSVFQANMIGAAQFNPATANPDLVSGDPVVDMEHWEFQGPTGRCAIYAQKFVIEEAIGREVPIEELVAVAEEHGWFNEASGGGTTTLNMDKLLEYYGVESEMSFNNDINALEEALNSGKNVIVGVDSGQIWYGDPNNIFSPETQADHAVQVIGIDHTNPENPMVVLNDSGTPEGCGELVPLDVFENAWNAGDSQMIVCTA